MQYQGEQQSAGVRLGHTSVTKLHSHHSHQPSLYSAEDAVCPSFSPKPAQEEDPELTGFLESGVYIPFQPWGEGVWGWCVATCIMTDSVFLLGTPTVFDRHGENVLPEMF